MKRYLITAALLGATLSASAFCGFYVAKTDATLLNKASQVIVTRDGLRSVITMSSDFEGDVKDFAMVVPVPVVLKRSDIRIKERSIFEKFNDYTAPRMAEYYDPEPCPPPPADTTLRFALNWDNYIYLTSPQGSLSFTAVSGVSVEAQYTIDEYDIVMLSATESGGLKKWLTLNGYKIPDKAEEVLEPYITGGMKFFVVKVNMDELKRRNPYVTGNVYPLRPIQLSFDSPKFMLPIRLGMANATAAQDMVVYMLSRKGRVETTNYRTVNVPTNQIVPVFVADQFTDFYHKVYEHALNQSARNVVFLEYAWDVTPQNPVPCDPCVGTPLYVNDLHDAGAAWASTSGPNTGQVYITRLHVTYDRAHYPQDLVFQETPNRENFQARYVRHVPARNNGFACDEAQTYLRELYERRVEEVYNYAELTGEVPANRDAYLAEFNAYLKPNAPAKKEEQKRGGLFGFSSGRNQHPPQLPMIFLSLFTLMAVFFALSRRRLAAAV